MAYKTDGTPEAAANALTVTNFYTAFKALDAKAMNACYGASNVFYDPVFEQLLGWRAKAMWTMLCERGKDLTVDFHIVSADKDHVYAHWDARYTFSRSGRPVLNQVDSFFTLRDGKIIDQQDSFDLWKWETQALGCIGAVCGCCGFFQRKLRATSREALDKYIQDKGLSETSDL